MNSSMSISYFRQKAINHQWYPCFTSQYKGDVIQVQQYTQYEAFYSILWFAETENFVTKTNCVMKWWNEGMMKRQNEKITEWQNEERCNDRMSKW